MSISTTRHILTVAAAAVVSAASVLVAGAYIVREEVHHDQIKQLAMVGADVAQEGVFISPAQLLSLHYSIRNSIDNQDAAIAFAEEYASTVCRKYWSATDGDYSKCYQRMTHG